METTQSQTTFSRWAFKLFLYYLMSIICVVILAWKYEPGIHHPEKFQTNMTLLSIIGNVLLIGGISLTYLSYRNKEPMNYQFFVPLIGFSFFVIYWFLFKLVPILFLNF